MAGSPSGASPVGLTLIESEGPVGSPEITIICFEPRYDGALQGFVTCLNRELGIRFHRLHIFSQGAKQWTQFPRRPKLANGKATRAKSGGYVSDPIVSFMYRQSKERFDEAVFRALESYLEQEKAV